MTEIFKGPSDNSEFSIVRAFDHYEFTPIRTEDRAYANLHPS